MALLGDFLPKQIRHHQSSKLFQYFGNLYSVISIFLKVCNVLFLTADVGSACLRTLDWAIVMQERDIANLLWGQLLNERGILRVHLRGGNVTSCLISMLKNHPFERMTQIQKSVEGFLYLSNCQKGKLIGRTLSTVEVMAEVTVNAKICNVAAANSHN